MEDWLVGVWGERIFIVLWHNESEDVKQVGSRLRKRRSRKTRMGN